jgi:hypothetical protein
MALPAAPTSGAGGTKAVQLDADLTTALKALPIA